MARPTAGLHYPRSLGEFSSWFGTDADCLDYLEWLRWSEGFVCAACGDSRAWRLGPVGIDGTAPAAGARAVQSFPSREPMVSARSTSTLLTSRRL